jgi:dTDP-4-amino-4,6-dideoxygalactose transaminase
MTGPVRFIHPSFPSVEEVAEDYGRILERGMFSNGGPEERELVRSVERWVGRGTSACAVSSATAGLDLAVRVTFRAERRSALVASFTFAAGPLTLVRAGFDPVFMDIDHETWQPSWRQAAEWLERHHDDCAGILLTSTYGIPSVDVGQWERLAEKHAIPLVLDSAAGFGAHEPDGTAAGSRGSCEVFSMHATKTLAAGEGGLVVSRSRELVSRVERLRNFGFDDSRQVTGAGTNAKLDELTSAIARRQLGALTERVRARREVVSGYRAQLEPMGFEFPPGLERSAPAFVPCLLPSTELRDRMRKTLAAVDVETRDYYNPPIHRQSYFSGSRRCAELAVTDEIAGRVLSLPISDHWDGADTTRIAAAVSSVVA